MANNANSLSYTKWMCKYHIVFTPKYRRKINVNCNINLYTFFATLAKISVLVLKYMSRLGLAYSF